MPDMTTVTALLPDGCAFTAVDDFRNIKRSRNISNTDRWMYNCAGYALGTYNWLIPFFTGSSVDDETWDAIYNHGGSNEDIDYGFISDPEEYTDFILYKTEVYENYLDIYKDYITEELAYWESEYGREPLDEEDIDDEYCDQLFSHIFYECYYDHPIALELAAMMMLKCFPDMRRIHSFEDVKEDEYGIAYAAEISIFVVWKMALFLIREVQEKFVKQMM